MITCGICGKNMGFFDYVASVPYEDGLTLDLCEECEKQQKMMGCSPDAVQYFRDKQAAGVASSKGLVAIDNWLSQKEAAKKEREEALAQNAARRAARMDDVLARCPELVAALAELQDEPKLLLSLEGCRGRSMKLYDDRVVINTDFSIGSVLTGNAFDGEKTVFFPDIVGIQYRDPSTMIGYLQFETASGTQNNEKSNFFNENTFTFEESDTAILAQMAKEYVVARVAQVKKANG